MLQVTLLEARLVFIEHCYPENIFNGMFFLLLNRYHHSVEVRAARKNFVLLGWAEVCQNPGMFGHSEASGKNLKLVNTEEETSLPNKE